MQTLLQSIMRDTTRADIQLLYKNLREEDLRDIKALGRCSVFESLSYGYDNARLCVTFVRPDNPDIVVGIGGVTTDKVVWVLFHKDFLNTKEDRQLLLSVSKPVLDYFKTYTTDTLRNITLSTNVKILKWLKWLGATTINKGRLTFFQFNK